MFEIGNISTKINKSAGIFKNFIWNIRIYLLNSIKSLALT